MYRYFYLWTLLYVVTCLGEVKTSLTPHDITTRTQRIMSLHASQKEFTPNLMQRILLTYIDHLDSNKIYFTRSDIAPWLETSEDVLNKLIEDYQNSNFETFEKIHLLFVKAIQRRQQIEQRIDYNHLPTQVKADEFKDSNWVSSEEELDNRIKRIRSLQLETTAKFNEEIREKTIQRMRKRQAKYEDEMINALNTENKSIFFANILKALASSLDAHTVYFTPHEATQFMINVQQRLFGIGAQLTDDINGFSITKVVEGGPIALDKRLKIKDRIIAVNGEPVVGMEINDVVDLIRGEDKTPVLLTVIRDTIGPNGTKNEEKIEVTITRGEVVLEEARFKSSYEPFGNGVIGYLKLHSFYEDRDHSSALDLEREINKLKEKHTVLGIVLDLRYNSGGLLSQAVAVTGLFISKGIVVSIKNEKGKIKHLRQIHNQQAWNGPLLVLVNSMSASASEIVSQTLQDYGRAIIIGDKNTFGKGSYQTFTLNAVEDEAVDPHGEYKVTRGGYYTVSGKTPQLVGVESDIFIPGPLLSSEVGEKFAKYPLQNDSISPNFEDTLADIPNSQRAKIRDLYKFDLQKKEQIYNKFLNQLKSNTETRINSGKNYQNFLVAIQKVKENASASLEDFGQNDLQLEEAYQVMKDLVLMQQENSIK